MDYLLLAYHILPYLKCNSASLPALYTGRLYMSETTVRERNVTFLWATSVWGECYLLFVFSAILNCCPIPAHHTPLSSNALDDS